MGKSCIPIVVQAHFKLDGWLYRLFSGKESIDFINFSFDISINKLIKEIEKLKPSRNIMPNNITLELTSDESSLQYLSDKKDDGQNLEPSSFQSEIIEKTKKNFDASLLNKKLYKIEEIPFIDSEEYKPSQWDNLELQDWVEKQNFSTQINQFLKNFNGEILKQLFLVKSEAPEYFYKLVSNNSTIQFENVAKFVIKLNELFS
jgi:hypothetical protein